MLDLVRDDQHAAIRLGTGEWPGVTGEKLLDEWLVPVCTPELYAKHGPLKRREDIGRYPLVHSTSEPWTAWLLERKAVDDTTSPFTGTRVDDSAAVVRLALQGLGLALARWSLAGDDVAAGRLVVASDEAAQLFPYLLAAAFEARPRAPRVRAVPRVAQGRDGEVPAPAGALSSRRGCAPKPPVQQEMLRLRGNRRRPQQRDVRHGQHDMIR